MICAGALSAGFPAPAPIRFDAGGFEPEKLKKAEQETADRGRGGKLRCRACRQVVTDSGQRMSVNGDHVHTRSNPAGIRFRFGCFREAPGCSRSGDATGDHTWFPGCRWRVALCRGCGEHLGWSFEGAQAFYGLILSRLVTDPDEGG